MAPKRVAIVGSGVSGIGALWALKTTDYEVHLFEADQSLGGHTNTVTYSHNGNDTPVDTGFIVFNSATYPNFIEFLKCIGITAVPTDMTFGVSRDQGEFEWAGTSLSAVFAQRSKIFSPRMWRMIFDIVRFNLFALDLLHEEDESEGDPSGADGYRNGLVEGKSTGTHQHHQPRSQQSIGEYLDQEGYSDAFKNDYLIPMTAAVWSTSPEKCTLDFPAVTLVRFMWNHHLLNTVAARPTWMTIPGGSQQYIDAVLDGFPEDQIHLDCPVTGVEDINDKVILQFESEEPKEELFDHVILACHGNQAMEIIRDCGTQEEREILSGFQTSENIAYLHSDLTLMPRRRVAWSAWNLMTTSPAHPDPSTDSAPSPTAVCLTYNMNILQHLPTDLYGDILVTLNPTPLPAPSTIQSTWTYHHPLYNARTIQSQKLLPRIQNTRGVSFAGAWTKYGFHEDGFSSGLKVAMEHLGAKLPFEFVDSTFSRGRRPKYGLGDWVARWLVWWMALWIGFGDFWVRILTVPWRVVARLGGSKSRRKVE